MDNDGVINKQEESYYESGELESKVSFSENLEINESFHKNGSRKQISAYKEGSLNLFFDINGIEVPELANSPYYMKEAVSSGIGSPFAYLEVFKFSAIQSCVPICTVWYTLPSISVTCETLKIGSSVNNSISFFIILIYKS